ncbi:hypothetical protein GA0061081_1022 [Gilliamella bombicola]|uniref:Uncharacterized protein n=1 Tax=Gilliamella bombicola TaxID=1798182 RepID=A0A1C3ZLV1_9GAMM|nr:hypothetical protein [Gilliamella bombicola]SCB83275.1 hypothetical protein GA0061081_1022 [Gilliamella bombicola]
MVFATLLLLPYSQSSLALTAYTSKVIQGSAPYLTFDGGRTKATTTDTLLAIELPDGRTITPSTNTSSSTNPIRLVNGSTFNDIHMLVPTGANTVRLNDLITQGNWGDDDGDGQGTNDVTATGSLSVSITDKNGRRVSRSDTLSVCSAPYRVTLRSTSGSLVTRYGVPNSSTFSGSSVVYYINPNINVGVCYARPSLWYGGTGFVIDDVNDGSENAGPSNIWSPVKGFLTQSTTPSSYGLNFPTTGSDGLYFDLDIVGIDASQLTWSVATNGSISATVSRTRPRSGAFREPRGNNIIADAWISDKSSYVTRVTLNGPRASDTQIDSWNPSRLRTPSLPQTFELVGRDRQGNEVRYGFVLKQWFVNRGKQTGFQDAQSSWCNRLGYRLVQVKDLTNSNIEGANPSSGGNHFQRRIGAGFFTEWGSVFLYAGADFAFYRYWSDSTNSRHVEVRNGSVWSDAPCCYYNVCTTP